MIESIVTAGLGPYWTAICVIAGYNAITTLGLYLSNSAGALSVGHAAIAGLGGYTGAVLTTKFGWPLPVALLAGGLVGTVVGSLLAVATLRMNAMAAGLTTLAFGETAVVIAYNTDYLGGSTSFIGIPAYTSLDSVVVVLIVAIFVVWRIDRSGLGYGARACRSNSLAAAAMGVRVPLVKVAVFAVGAGLAAIGGVLRAHYVLVENPSELGFAESIVLVMYWVVGGSFSLWGAVAGAIVLTIAPELLRFAAYERYLVFGVLVTAVLIARPQGVIGRIPLGDRRPLRSLRFRSWRGPGAGSSSGTSIDGV